MRSQSGFGHRKSSQVNRTVVDCGRQTPAKLRAGAHPEGGCDWKNMTVQGAATHTCYPGRTPKSGLLWYVRIKQTLSMPRTAKPGKVHLLIQPLAGSSACTSNSRPNNAGPSPTYPRPAMQHLLTSTARHHFFISAPHHTWTCISTTVTATCHSSDLHQAYTGRKN